MAVIVAVEDFIDDVIKISPTYPIYAIFMSAYKLNAAASKSEISEWKRAINWTKAPISSISNLSATTEAFITGIFPASIKFN